MIRELDNMLRTLLVAQVSELVAEAQVSFRPPDEDWRTEVFNLQQMGLNLYMVDLRENRKLRSNATVRVGEVNGQVIFDAAPSRVDCHYLVTAWSPAQPGQAVEPTLDEHNLLYQTMAALTNAQPLNPVRVYGENNPILNNLPLLFKRDMPTQVLPVEGFIKQPEFWGTMGQNHRWRPAIYLIVTLPLALVIPPAGPVVTTPAAVVKRSDREGMPDELYTIGGRVIDATQAPQTPARPVANAWVQLSLPNGERLATVYTDEDGRFVFRDIHPGEYRLAWRAQGIPAPAAPRAIIVPSPTGEYDLSFE
jgi:hypothetical protein